MHAIRMVWEIFPGIVIESNKNDLGYRWFACRCVFYLSPVYICYIYIHSILVHAVHNPSAIIVCTGYVLAFAVLRPYKNDWYNKLDAAIFAMYNYVFLIIINCLQCACLFSLYVSSCVHGDLCPLLPTQEITLATLK